MTSRSLASLVLASTLLVCAPIESRAENCADLLRFAGETWTTKSSSERSESLVTWFCSRAFDSESSATSAAADASIPIEGVLVGFGLSGSGSSFSDKQRELCSTEEARLAAAGRAETRVQTINPAVAEAVRLCVLGRASGIWANLEETANPRAFKILISKKNVDAPTSFRSFSTVPPVSCSPSPRSGDPITSTNLEILCTRTEPKEAVDISINTFGVGLYWVGASSLPAHVAWPETVYPPCSSGGAAFYFPRDHIASMTGTLFVEAVIKQAARCNVNSVKFHYDCNWPDTGPTWRLFSSSAPERPLENGDVPVRARLDLAALQDGRNAAVPAGAACQLRALVQYQDGHEVANFAGFMYGSH